MVSYLLLIAYKLSISDSMESYLQYNMVLAKQNKQTKTQNKFLNLTSVHIIDVNYVTECSNWSIMRYATPHKHSHASESKGKYSKSSRVPQVL